MYRYDLSLPYRTPASAAVSYFHLGHSIFRTVEQVVSWRFGGFAGVRSVLDFASGYGRVTRFLAAALPPRRVFVSDIDAEAVRFQSESLGVHGRVSSREPERFAADACFDVVLAVSFFSHLPAERFERWLQRLYALVAPGGLLIFSVHGMGLLAAGDADDGAGIVYRPVSESTRLDAAEYGTSYVSPEFVRAAIAQAADEPCRVFEFPHGLGSLQDLYVAARPPLPRLPALRVHRAPLGALDASNIEDGLVSIEGWAEGEPDERPPDVSLHFGESVAAVSGANGSTGGRRRWRFGFPVAAVSRDRLIRVEALSPRGFSGILVMGTLRPYLEDAAG
jgi:SAM-dependent methyltransferase